MRPERSFPEWVATLRSTLTDPDTTATAGWVPAMDVLDRPEGLEIRLDLAGVAASAVQVAVRGSLLVVTGDKGPAGCRSGALFHVAERTCGRFARSIPLRLAFDASAIRATLERGELRVAVPRIDDTPGRHDPRADRGP